MGASLPPLSAPAIAAVGGALAADVASGDALTAAGMSAKGAALTNVGNVGIRIFGGRIYNPKTLSDGVGSGITYEVLMTTAQHFDAVRIITAMGNTDAADATTPSCNGAVAVVGDPSDATISAASWTGLTWGGTNGITGGNSTTTLPPSANNASRVFKISDIIPISSVPRTDGGAYPLLVARVYLYQSTGASKSIVILGNGSDSFSNWATHPSGRTWRMLNKNGVFAASSQTGMTSANSSVGNGSPIVGIIYYARGKVVNVAAFGDSITDGRGTYLGEGFGFPACQTLSASTGIPFEYSNMGWSGQNTSRIRDNVFDAISAGLKFDVALLPGGSPNDISTTITSALVTTAKRNLQVAAEALRANGSQVIVWTWLPTNTAVKNYGATDSLRIAANNEYRAWAGKGCVIADFDARIAGTTSGGQVQMLAGTTSDDIHPNDTGNALLSPVAASAISGVIGIRSGVVA